MASVDVPVALLGYGTVGSAVNRLLTDSADDIERATGHRLRVVKALVRDAGKERDYPPSGGVLTTDFREIADDPSIAVVAEVMGGVEQTASCVIELLNRGKHVVSANKQLIAQRGPERFAAASAAGVQLRFEASVCAAIPVIKVLRESLVVTNVHRVLGIVNGTTNFVLTEMEAGKSYDEALADAQERGYAEADPTDDVSGADAAAKMAILATVAFNSRVGLADVAYTGITTVDSADVKAARDLDMVIRLVGAARLVDGSFDVRVEPALVDKQHPLAKVDGAFNAVMLQGDAIREITLEGPGAGGVETASAVIADMVSVIGTMGTGFLQNDAAWRELPRLPSGESSSPFYFRLSVEDRPGALARVADELAQRDVSIARLLQQPNGSGASLHVVTHEARAGALADALEALGSLPEVHKRSRPLPVISDRGVSELGVGVTSLTSALSLGEGSTPLVAAGRLSHETGYDLHLKLEGANPTGSFKDRGMVVAVARAVEVGARAVVCASTGNTAASAAAYAARAGLDAVVLTPAGATATAKRAQAVAAGARLIELRGSFDDALRICRELGARPGFVLVNSLNPNRIEGQKRVVGELLEQLGAVPDVVALPFGGGGNVTAVAAGLEEAGLEVRIVIGQAAERSTTWASAIRIAEPAHAEHVAALVAAGRVEVVTLSEDELRRAWHRLAQEEGAFCEPASAAGLAALIQLGPGNGETAVCILTGHGLKDTGAVEGLHEDAPVVATELDAVLEAIG